MTTPIENAQRALNAFARITDYQGEADTRLQDLLSSLMLYANARGINWSRTLRQAGLTFQDELEMFNEWNSTPDDWRIIEEDEDGE